MFTLTVEPYYTEFAEVDSEFSLDNLTGWQVLAEGNFGIVYKATAKDICGNKGYSVVAVKKLKGEAINSYFVVIEKRNAGKL